MLNAYTQNGKSGAALYHELVEMGVGHMSFNRFEEASSYFSRAIEVDGTSPDSFIYRAIANYNLKKYKQAVDDNSRALNIYGGNSRVLLRRGICYRDMGKLREALSDFTRALELDPSYGLAYFHRAKALADVFHPDSAIGFGACTAAVLAEAAVVTSHPDAAERLRRAGRAADGNPWANACLTRARGRLDQNPSVLYEAADLWGELGARFERAATLLLTSKHSEGRAELAALGVVD